MCWVFGCAWAFLHLRVPGFSLPWLLLLWIMGSRHAGSVVVAHGLSCPMACGIFLDQGSKLCPLHWQEESYPLDHQGNPGMCVFTQAHADLTLRDTVEYKAFPHNFHTCSATPVWTPLLPSPSCSASACSVPFCQGFWHLFHHHERCSPFPSTDPNPPIQTTSPLLNCHFSGEVFPNSLCVFPV